ncbi:MAG: hypothetical protein RSG77_21525 [Hafnia sp.]
MHFTIGKSPELARFVLNQFTSDLDGHPDVLAELTRFFWNTASYRVAKRLHDDGAQDIMSGDEKNFVYDRRTDLVFFNVTGGAHQMLISYFSALHQTDFSKSTDHWFDTHFVQRFDARSKLADEYIGAGQGLFQSSVGGKDRIYVSADIEFDSLERQAFRRFEKIDPNA